MSFSSEEKKKYMQLAFEQARKAETKGEVPIGAILVDPEGQEIGRAHV